MNQIIHPLTKNLAGTIGWYYRHLGTGETHEHQARQPYLAASVIKLSILLAVFQAMEEGRCHRDDRLVLQEADKLPSCGALTDLHPGLEITLQDCYRLMITLSDNTATNLLIQRVGMDWVNEVIQSAGLSHTQLNRLLFDSEAQQQGRENTFSPADAGKLLEMIHRRTFVSEAWSLEAEAILKRQQLKNKLRALIPRQIPIGHKTGEDTDITHDVGIIYTRQPFILCLAANGTDVIQTEEVFRQVALRCYQYTELSCTC
ncbi:serine hydrolase [Anoxynatronum sibiricum]|uniref:Serine hydrolase n=1 Tax=Anoxynatronum sibiricum TaxID=210623 RepID=A0ABU9VT42_9CLOT